MKKESTELDMIKKSQGLDGSRSDDNPTLFEQVRSAGIAVAKFSASGFNATIPEILSYRESICRSCDQWDSAALNNTGRCKKCGCSTWAKLRMATERCPLGKWEAVSAEDSKQQIIVEQHY